MKSEDEQVKHSGGRPKKIIKKDTITGVRFSNIEHCVVKQKAAKAGLGITVYIREMALKGEVIARLSDEERQFVREIVGMSTNINQMTRKAHQEGLLKAMLFFESYRNQLDELLKKLKR